MVKDSVYYLLSKGLPAILSFAILFMYLTNMNAKDYGYFSIIILSIGLVNIITSQWIRSGMLRYYNEYKDLVGTAITSQIVLIVVICIFIMPILYIMNFNLINIVLIELILMNFIANEFLNNYYRARIMPKVVLYGNLIKNFVYVVGLLTLWSIGVNIRLEHALLSFCLGIILSNVYFFMHREKQINYNVNKKLIHKFAYYGIPLTVSFALGVLLQNIDKFMISYQLGVTRTGDYSLVYDFVHNSLYMVMGALGMASLPRILKLKSLKQRIGEFNKYILILYIISLPILGVFITISTDMTKVFERFGYSTSWIIIVMIVILTFIHGINSFVYGQAIQMMEDTKLIFIPAGVAVVINIVLNLILLPRIGLISAAISGMIAFFTSNILLYKLIAKDFQINFFPKRIWVSVIIMIIGILATVFIDTGNVYITILVKSLLLILLQILILTYLMKKRFFVNSKEGNN